MVSHCVHLYAVCVADSFSCFGALLLDFKDLVFYLTLSDVGLPPCGAFLTKFLSLLGPGYVYGRVSVSESKFIFSFIVNGILVLEVV